MLRSRRCNWVCVTASVWSALALGFAAFSYRYPWSHTLYDIYAQAARRWWAGQDIYHAVGTAYYRYSPLFAIGMTGFAELPDRWGNALWRIFSCAVYAAALWAWARHTLAIPCTRSQSAALFLLVLPISLPSMYNGQANVIMMGAILLGLAALGRERFNQGAGWLALATLIKGYPLALAFLLAAVHGRRFLGRFAAALTLGLLLPFATQRPAVVVAQYTSWLAHLRASTAIMRERLRSVDYLFALYGHPLTPARFLGLELLAGLTILVLSLVYARRTSDLRRQTHMAFTLFALWVVLFGPATEACTYVVIAPPLAWALVDAFSRPVSLAGRLLLIASLLMMGPLVTDFAGSAPRNFANQYGSQPMGALLFAVYLLTQIGNPRFPGIMRTTPLRAPLDEAA